MMNEELRIYSSFCKSTELKPISQSKPKEKNSEQKKGRIHRGKYKMIQIQNLLLHIYYKGSYALCIFATRIYVDTRKTYLMYNQLNFFNN